jgi:hypothetical protein
LLAQDIEANMSFLQLAGAGATLALALIGVVLSMRAYAVLSEARALYWQASKLSAAAASEAGPRAARSAAINASHSKRKIRSNRLRGIV